MLKDLYINFVENASNIPNFVVGQKEDVPYDIDVLANEYCKAQDNNDKEKMSYYLSALMVRYWHMVPCLFEQSKSSRLEIEDMVFWLYEAFMKAFKYRSWIDPNKKVSSDPKGAEKCFNQCITSVRNYWYNYFNKDKRKINYISYSIDDLIPDSSDSSEKDIAMVETLAAQEEDYDYIKEIIQQYLDKGDILTALVLDGIVYHDSFVTTIKVKNKTIKDSEDNDMEIKEINTKNTFVQTKLIKHLTTLNKDFEDYFYDKYKVDKDNFKEIILNINKLTDSALLRRVKKSINLVKNNVEVKKALCI